MSETAGLVKDSTFFVQRFVQAWTIPLLTLGDLSIDGDILDSVSLMVDGGCSRIVGMESFSKFSSDVMTSSWLM